MKKDEEMNINIEKKGNTVVMTTDNILIKDGDNVVGKRTQTDVYTLEQIGNLKNAIIDQIGDINKKMKEADEKLEKERAKYMVRDEKKIREFGSMIEKFAAVKAVDNLKEHKQSLLFALKKCNEDLAKINKF